MVLEERLGALGLEHAVCRGLAQYKTRVLEACSRGGRVGRCCQYGWRKSRRDQGGNDSIQR